VSSVIKKLAEWGVILARRNIDATNWRVSVRAKWIVWSFQLVKLTERLVRVSALSVG
jgi:hypothetical protein